MSERKPRAKKEERPAKTERLSLYLPPDLDKSFRVRCASDGFKLSDAAVDAIGAWCGTRAPEGSEERRVMRDIAKAQKEREREAERCASDVAALAWAMQIHEGKARGEASSLSELKHKGLVANGALTLQGEVVFRALRAPRVTVREAAKLAVQVVDSDAEREKLGHFIDGLASWERRATAVRAVDAFLGLGSHRRGARDVAEGLAWLAIEAARRGLEVGGPDKKRKTEIASVFEAIALGAAAWRERWDEAGSRTDHLDVYERLSGRFAGTVEPLATAVRWRIRGARDFEGAFARALVGRVSVSVD